MRAMAMLPLDGPSATIGDLAKLNGARFLFICRPCNHTASFTPADVLARPRMEPELLLKHFQRLVICAECRMKVDDVFRTLDFTSTEYLHRLQQEGHTGGGWSGPKT